MNDGPPTQPAASETGSHVDLTQPISHGPNQSGPVYDTETEKERVLTRVKNCMEQFRDHSLQGWEATAAVVDELDKWVGASEEERRRALQTCFEEINSQAIIANATTNPEREIRSTRLKRKRDEIGDLVDRLSQQDEDSDGQDEPVRTRYRARAEDMPWFKPKSTSSRTSTNFKSARILQAFAKDVSGCKTLLRTTEDLPKQLNGFPDSQWDKILRGQLIDLDLVLSSLNGVQLTEERKGRLGDTEIVLAPIEAKRTVRSASEWSTAFRQARRAIVFAFPHREEELAIYQEHIENLFDARLVSAHPQVLLYDKAVRSYVGGGQNASLTDKADFDHFKDSILCSDGLEYASSSTFASSPKRGSSSKVKIGTRGSESKDKICRNFNNGNCKFSERGCRWKHHCSNCGKTGHGGNACPTKSA